MGSWPDDANRCRSNCTHSRLIYRPFFLGTDFMRTNPCDDARGGQQPQGRMSAFRGRPERPNEREGPILEAAPFEDWSLPRRKYWATYCTRSAVGSGRSCATVLPLRPAADGRVNALSHLGDLHCGVRRRMIRVS